MNKLLKTLAASATLLWSLASNAAPQNYVYTPTVGVNEVKPFHGCFDDDVAANRPQINVIMSGLSSKDVTIETRPLVVGKPSSEQITFRVKNKNASITVQFLSNDGTHCQQGVASIVFTDVTYRNFADLKVTR